MNPYVLLGALVLWIATAAGAFKYGQHVREAELQAQGAQNTRDAQKRADDEAAELRAKWDADHSAGIALDEEVSAYAATDASRTDCFDPNGLQLFNAIAAGVPVSAAGHGAMPTNAPQGAGRQPSGGPAGSQARSR